MTSTLTQHKALPALTLALCMLMAACTLQPIGTTQPGTNTARELSARGDHPGASRIYLDQALATKGTQRQRYLIFAAGELYLANDLDGTERILDQAGLEIAPDNMEVWVEVVAELQLARNKPAAALGALNQISRTDRQSSASRILLLRSEALFQLGRPEAAVTTLLQREAVLTGHAEVAANNRLIWTGIQGAGASIPPDPSAMNGDPVLTGWLQLGHIAFRQRSSLNGLYTSLDNWRQSNQTHPASGSLLTDVLSNLRALSTYPPQVAMLLPLSGKQKAEGAAIRDGYLAAHFDLGNDTERPDIRIYDTDSEGAIVAYQKAVVNGASFIIGPLLKDEVGAIAPLVVEITTLALNTVPEGTRAPDYLFQFALAPEDEASAVATRATADGLYNAIALVPASDWGRRILGAFEQELGTSGGKLLASATYPDSATDFSAIIKDALLLDESFARRDRLAANLGKKLEFEPRRRQDIDFIFIAANAPTAKLLKPQLRFHYAGDIPTYATSKVYQPGTSDNGDINGIIFPDIPWLLHPNPAAAQHFDTLNAYWGKSILRLTRFFAMGYDSYHLTAMLNDRSARNSHLNMEGMTGRLHVDRQGILHRELKWARMERGTTRTLPDVPRSLMQDAEIVLSQQ